MKLPGTVYLVPKTFFHFLVLMTMTFIQLYKAKKINFISVNKKRSSSENVLLDKLSDAIIAENLENSSSYFDVDNVKTKFSKNLKI